MRPPPPPPPPVPLGIEGWGGPAAGPQAADLDRDGLLTLKDVAIWAAGLLSAPLSLVRGQASRISDGRSRAVTRTALFEGKATCPCGPPHPHTGRHAHPPTSPNSHLSLRRERGPQDGDIR